MHMRVLFCLVVNCGTCRCASLMWRAGNLPESSACPSAIDAYHKSTIN
jgi:hypothetical protein